LIIRDVVRMSEENIRGYARVMARVKVQQQMNKPLFGMPYMKFGEGCATWGYFFQLGAILGTRHASNLDAFGQAFLGTRGPIGAVASFLEEVAEPIVASLAPGRMTFMDYVGTVVTASAGYEGDWHSFLLAHGREKLAPEAVESRAWRFSTDGAALGVSNPQFARTAFDQTYAAVPDEDWKRARASGLDIAPEQVWMSYEAAEKGEDEAFLEYCNECCPDLYSILMG
jgi:hypothetical protein